jgi:hypothetical protein
MFTNRSRRAPNLRDLLSDQESSNFDANASKMTDEVDLQIDSSQVLKQPPIELTFPHIPVSLPNIRLRSRHLWSARMADEATDISNDAVLSGSWTNLSDVDYSLDDDLRSETTDAASLVDHTGPDDVHSICDRTSEGSCQDTQSERDEPDELSPHDILFESARTLKADTGSNSIVLQRQADSIDALSCNAKLILRSYTHGEINEYLPLGSANDPEENLLGCVSMSMSQNTLNVGRPFRLWYIGSPTARVRILAKIRDVLRATSEQPPSRCRPDSSQNTSFSSGDVPGSTAAIQDSNNVPAQMTVDDCTTVASIEHDTDPMQIFLSFKNGTLYSSRWNGTKFEVSSASEWICPDLAIFFVAPDDHLLLRQRHQLAEIFVSRHNIPSLNISETLGWTKPSNFSPQPSRLQYRIERSASVFRTPILLRSLPVDLETFETIDSTQLSQHFAFLHQPTNFKTVNSPHDRISAPTCAPSHGTEYPRRQETRDASASKPAGFWWTFNPACRNFPALELALVIFLITIWVWLISMLMLKPSLPDDGRLVEPIRPTNWSLQPCVVSTSSGRAASLLPTASGAKGSGSMEIPKGLSVTGAPSDLAHLITSKTTNESDHFQIHSIGDCHIIVKTPRGLRAKSKTPPFDALVLRGEKVLLSSISKLFDGVYTIYVQKEEAYGLVKVVIKHPKSVTRETHLINLGAPWLRVAGWKKAAQIVSEQILEDLKTAQVALTTVYDKSSDDLRLRTRTISVRASQRARKILQDSRLVVNQRTARAWAKSARSWAKSTRVRAGTARLGDIVSHAWQSAYNQVSEQADTASQAVMVYARRTNEHGRTIYGEILNSANQSAVRLQQCASWIDAASVQNILQEHRHSEVLAKAQERAQQLMRGTISDWVKRRTWRKTRNVSSGNQCRSKNR